MKTIYELSPTLRHTITELCKARRSRLAVRTGKAREWAESLRAVVAREQAAGTLSAEDAAAVLRANKCN